MAEINWVALLAFGVFLACILLSLILVRLAKALKEKSKLAEKKEKKKEKKRAGKVFSAIQTGKVETARTLPSAEFMVNALAEEEENARRLNPSEQQQEAYEKPIQMDEEPKVFPKKLKNKKKLQAEKRRKEEEEKRQKEEEERKLKEEQDKKLKEEQNRKQKEEQMKAQEAKKKQAGKPNKNQKKKGVQAAERLEEVSPPSSSSLAGFQTIKGGKKKKLAQNSDQEAKLSPSLPVIDVEAIVKERVEDALKAEVKMREEISKSLVSQVEVLQTKLNETAKDSEENASTAAALSSQNEELKKALNQMQQKIANLSGEHQKAVAEYEKKIVQAQQEKSLNRAKSGWNRKANVDWVQKEMAKVGALQEKVLMRNEKISELEKSLQHKASHSDSMNGVGPRGGKKGKGRMKDDNDSPKKPRKEKKKGNGKGDDMREKEKSATFEENGLQEDHRDSEVKVGDEDDASSSVPLESDSAAPVEVM